MLRCCCYFFPRVVFPKQSRKTKTAGSFFHLCLSIHYFITFLAFFSSFFQLSCLTVFFSSALTLPPTAFKTNFAGFAVRKKQTTLSLSLHHPLFLSHTQVGICQRYKGARRGHCKSFLQTWSLHIQHNQRS